MRTARHSGRNRVVMPTYQLGASPLNFLVPGTWHSCPPQTDFAKIIFNIQSLAQVIVYPVCSVSPSHFSRSSLCLPFSILIYASDTWSVCIISTGSLALGLLIGLGQWQTWQEMREWGGRLQYVGSPLSHPLPHTYRTPSLGNSNVSLSLPLQAWGYKISQALLALTTVTSLVVSSLFAQTSVNCSIIKLSLVTHYLSAIYFLSRFRLIHPDVYTWEQ